MRRCLTIGDSLEVLGADVIYLVSDAASAAFPKAAGKAFVCLHSSWEDYEDRADRLLAALEMHGISCLLADSYHVSDAFFKQLSGVVKTAYLDDTGSAAHPVDMLINYSILAEQLSYAELYPPGGTRLLLGCRYVPLRREFSVPIKQHPFKQASGDILITTGASDPLHIAASFIESCRAQPALKQRTLSVVAGRYCEDHALLRQLASGRPEVRLHFNVSAMAEIMYNSAAAVTAGGATVYELCACGVPFAGISFADNHLPGLLAFDRLGLAPYCGDARSGVAHCVENAWAALDSLLAGSDYPVLSEKLSRLVDGRGAQRIAAEIMKLAETHQ